MRLNHKRHDKPERHPVLLRALLTEKGRRLVELALLLLPLERLEDEGSNVAADGRAVRQCGVFELLPQFGIGQPEIDTGGSTIDFPETHGAMFGGHLSGLSAYRALNHKQPGQSTKSQVEALF